MKLNIMQVNDFLEDQGAKETTLSYILGSDGGPEDEGLFSTKIYGRIGSKERSTKFGYIHLKRYFLHPFVYNTMIKMFRATPQVVAGEVFVKLNPKDATLMTCKGDDPDGGTGIDFFIDNWRKINWRKTETRARIKKDEVISSLKPNEIFLTKFPVCPAMYRDINLHSQGSGKITHDEVNKLYIKLINATNSESITFTSGYYTQATVQNTLLEIYKLFLGKVAKKNGIIQKNIMGKTVDFAAVNVISAPRFNSNTYKEMQVPFGYIGVPLYMVLALFYPHIVKAIEDYFFDMNNQYEIQIGKDKIIKNDETFNKLFGPDGIRKLVSAYISDKTREIRTKPFSLDGKDAYKSYYQAMGRPYTITDFLLDIANQVVQNKFVLSTRFPLTGSESQAINRIKILTTEKTIPLQIESRKVLAGGEVEYIPNFPTDSEGNIIDNQIRWIDTLVPNNSILAGMGGDYDGDTFRIIGIYTKEANAEALELSTRPMNFIDMLGNLTRHVAREGGLSIYMLTKD